MLSLSYTHTHTLSASTQFSVLFNTLLPFILDKKSLSIHLLKMYQEFTGWNDKIVALEKTT